MKAIELLYGLTEAEIAEVGIDPRSGYGGDQIANKFAGPGAGMEPGFSRPPAAAPITPTPGPSMAPKPQSSMGSGMSPSPTTTNGQFQTAGLGDTISNFFMSGKKPAFDGVDVPDPLHSSPTAAGTAAGNVMPGMGTVNNAIQTTNQNMNPQTK